MPFLPVQPPASMDTDGLRKHGEEQFREVARAWTEVDGSLTSLNNYINDIYNTQFPKFILRLGDTMTGHLALPTGPGAANAVRKDYVDAVGALKVNRAGDTMTGQLTSIVDTGLIQQAGPAPTVMIQGSAGHAPMSFHCVGSFGGNFGLANDGNFYMGGWSHGGAAYKFWTTRDGSMLTDGRLPYAGDTGPGAVNAYVDIVTHALLSGYYQRSTDGVILGARTRNVQGFRAGAWFTFPFA